MSQKRASKVKVRASRNRRKGPIPKGPWIPERGEPLTLEKLEEIKRWFFKRTDAA